MSAAAQGGQLHGLVEHVSSGSTDPFRNSAELLQIINRVVDTFPAQGRMEELFYSPPASLVQGYDLLAVSQA